MDVNFFTESGTKITSMTTIPMITVMIWFCRVQAVGSGNSGMVFPQSICADSTRAVIGFHSAMFFRTSGMVWIGTKAFEMKVSGNRIMKDALLITSGLRTLIPRSAMTQLKE